MTYQTIDYLFPFIVFFYGALMCLVLEFPALVRLGQTKLPPQLWGQMERHRLLAYLCLFVGGLWSLQQIWLLGY